MDIHRPEVPCRNVVHLILLSQILSWISILRYDAQQKIITATLPGAGSKRFCRGYLKGTGGMQLCLLYTICYSLENCSLQGAFVSKRRRVWFRISFSACAKIFILMQHSWRVTRWHLITYMYKREEEFGRISVPSIFIRSVFKLFKVVINQNQVQKKNVFTSSSLQTWHIYQHLLSSRSLPVWMTNPHHLHLSNTWTRKVYY